MKKRIFLAALASLAVVGMTSCGYDKKVREDSEATWVMHGQYLLSDGETVNGWNNKKNELYEASKMTATSVAEVAEYAQEVADVLKGKSIKYLYAGEAVFGLNDAGWTTNFLLGEDLYQANGSYAFKVARCLYDAAEDVYAEDQWISDAKTANAESLTPDTFFVPVWQEAADRFGFSWASNPVVIGGAGKYKMIVAQYTDVSAAGVPGYGIAAVKLEDGAENEKAQKYVKLEEFKPAEHTFGVIGSFAASNWGKAGEDIAMTKSADGKSYSAEVTLKAGDQFKVRADNDKNWKFNWAPSAAVQGVITLKDGNAVAAVDGTYIVTISNFGFAGTATVTVSLKPAASAA